MVARMKYQNQIRLQNAYAGSHTCRIPLNLQKWLHLALSLTPRKKDFPAVALFEFYLIF